MLLRKFWHNERAGIVVISLKLLAQSIRSHLTMPVLFSGDSSGVNPDTRKAILWYKEAAEQGYAHAQYTLGLIYRNGSGINVNHYESQKWLKLAAKQHYKNAKRLLAGLPAH